MMRVLWIGLGGGLGAMLRYGMSGWAQRFSGSVEFPYGTLVVNVLGCLAIGALAYLAEVRGALDPEARAFLITGVLGGFTTFSTFGNETLALAREGDQAAALANIAAHLALGLGAVWAGRWLAALAWR